MNLDWAHFTPGSSLAGGLLIGLSVAAFLLLNGRVLGISGILGGLLRPIKGDLGWRLAFLLGLLASAWLTAFFMPANWVLSARIDASDGSLMLAGLLVGLGTRYGSGCTSGHGVCGLSRLSPRSMVATLTFMLMGFLVVYVLKHGF
jgi:uncharacterized membrane protein YedE/YeeE